MRCKLGEALAKISKQLGDFSPVYFDELSSALLGMIENSNDEMVRASALSSLADLVVACRGRYFDKILQELLLCVSQLLSSPSTTAKNNDLVRRAAIHLLRSMIVSATMQQNNSSLFGVFSGSLAPITRELKRLYSSDADDVVRLHSELALIEIQEVVENSFRISGLRTIL